MDSCDAVDLLALVQASVARAEVVASKLHPHLHKILHDAKHLRKKVDGKEPEHNPLKLAENRGLESASEVHRIVGHLEHVLSVTYNLTQSHAHDFKTTVNK